MSNKNQISFITEPIYLSVVVVNFLGPYSSRLPSNFGAFEARFLLRIICNHAVNPGFIVSAHITYDFNRNDETRSRGKHISI